MPALPSWRRAAVVGALCAVALGWVALRHSLPVNGAQAASGADPDAPMSGRPNLAADDAAPGAATSSPPLTWPAAHHAADPEGRLLAIYRLIGQDRLDEALRAARALTDDVPNFQLAQLTYADLLMARSGKASAFGSAWGDTGPDVAARLAQLREEALQRIAALQYAPPAGTVPSQFLALAPSVKHAIAVDASRSRLYLFSNEDGHLKLEANFYVSVGRLGVRKRAEGDQRTPVGVYFITSRLSASQLKDFYGIGALPLNYPNEYDRRLGKTGGGIWLHGVPPDSYARSPQSTDGCVVLSNQDLSTLLSQITPRATPVVIAEHLDWRAPSALRPDRMQVLSLLKSWQQARESGDLQRLLSFYSPQFSNGSQDFSQWASELRKEVGREAHTIDEVKDLSVLRWRDRSDILVLTFAELRAGSRTGHIKRQYWGKENGSWKIFYEGVLG